MHTVNAPASASVADQEASQHEHEHIPVVKIEPSASSSTATAPVSAALPASSHDDDMHAEALELPRSPASALSYEAEQPESLLAPFRSDSGDLQPRCWWLRHAAQPRRRSSCRPRGR